MRARPWQVLGLVLVLASPLAGAPDPVRAKSHVDAALKLMRRGRLRDARLELDAASALAPGDPTIAELKASLDAPAGAGPAAGPVPGSSAALSATAKSEAGAKVESLLAAARAAYHDSDLRGADARWRDVLAVDAAQAQALQGLETLKQEAYRRDKDQPFDQSVAELYEAGLREMRKGRMVEARRKLEDAKALNPAQPQVLQALQWVAAGAESEQGGRDAESLVLEGRRLAADGQDDKAAAAFSAALQASPGMGSAEQGLKQIRQRNAAKVEAALAQGQAGLKAKDWAQAEQGFALALSLAPQDAAAQSGLAEARSQREGERSLASKRREADRLYNAGIEAWQASDLALAASRFRETLRVAPDDAEAAQALQGVQRKLDERAAKDRLDAAQLLKEGRTLESRGALDEASRRFERALAKDPGLLEAAQARDAVQKRIKGM